MMSPYMSSLEELFGKISVHIPGFRLDESFLDAISSRLEPILYRDTASEDVRSKASKLRRFADENLVFLEAFHNNRISADQLKVLHDKLLQFVNTHFQNDSSSAAGMGGGGAGESKAETRSSTTFYAKSAGAGDDVLAPLVRKTQGPVLGT